MELLKFNGTDFKSWYPKFEQYLEMEAVLEDFKPKVAMFAFEDPELHWHKFYITSIGGMENARWDSYLLALRKRFAFEGFADPLFDLVRLRHKGTVRSYYDDFMFLLNIAGIFEPHALSIFLANLKDDILGQLRLHKPSTLQQAGEISMLIESNLETTSKSLSYTKTTTTT
ncbi:hypothetical protein COLO4_10045 [Corchorus olitorius]|uniref:Retrotransposon gag protein n=1 Tax=Corchorus olitorius TaxID=93759 RepID=A0A1R3KA69_9ROSI|nr:hypothetical protein COLO4_10045 [Corchorus olitorius]